MKQERTPIDKNLKSKIMKIVWNKREQPPVDAVREAVAPTLAGSCTLRRTWPRRGKWNKSRKERNGSWLSKKRANSSDVGSLGALGSDGRQWLGKSSGMEGNSVWVAMDSSRSVYMDNVFTRWILYPSLYMDSVLSWIYLICLCTIYNRQIHMLSV
jgi:hypothetical protein